MAKTRSNNEGNIKLRSDGRYEVRVTVDYDKNRALKFAVAEGYINSNPASSVNLPSGDGPQIIILTRDEQMRLIQGSYQHHYGVFIRLVLFTGIRLGELLGLRWENVDVQGKRIYIRRMLNRLNKAKKPANPNEPTTEIVIQTPKSQNSVRSIPLLPQVLQDLQGWQRVHQSDKQAARPLFILPLICRRFSVTAASGPQNRPPFVHGSYSSPADVRSTFS